MQARHGLVEEEGQGVVVCVADCPDVVEVCIGGLGPRVILHVAQVFEAFGGVAVASDEVVFWDFKDVGEQAEEWE